VIGDNNNNMLAYMAPVCQKTSEYDKETNVQKIDIMIMCDQKVLKMSVWPVPLSRYNGAALSC